MTALLWICFCLLGLTNPAIARRPEGDSQPDGVVEEMHLRPNYFAADRLQEPTREVLATRVRRDVDNKVESLGTEKLFPIDHDELVVDDDIVEVIAAERKLQMTISEGIKRTYKVPNKNYNNKKNSKKKSSSSSSSTKKKSSSSSSSTKKKKKKSTKKSRSSSVTGTKSTRKSRSQRKRKKSLFKKNSKSKKKNDGKKTKDSSSKSKSKSRSGDQTCKSKAQVECRDDCIAANCGFADDKMCIRKCKHDCCVENETGDSDDRNEPTSAPVASGGGGPAPEPTTLQPAAPVAITPAPTVALPVVPRSCPSAVTVLTTPGSLGCSPGGCCVVASDTMQQVCNFEALSTAGVASIENGQIFVEEIDTSADGPFAIQAGCEISCTNQCRLSAAAQQIPEAPTDLTTFAGPGTISCTDGYCETTDGTGCNLAGFNAVGNVGTDENGKAVAWGIESAAAPVEIEAGCLIDCSESKCTFGRAAF